MKKLISALVLTSLLTTQVFAGDVLNKRSVTQVITNYKKQVLVNNVDQKVAFRNVIESINNNEIAIEDLLQYAKENSSATEYAALLEALTYGSNELDAMESFDSSEIEYLATNVLSITETTGASYRGCPSKAFFGTSAFVAGAFLAVRALSNYDDYKDSKNSPFGRDEEAKDDAVTLGIYAGLATATGAAIFATCR